MSNNIILHLAYRPMEGGITEGGADFLTNYSRRYYPRNLNNLAVHMRSSAIRLVQGSTKGAYAYEMIHYTDPEADRFFFEENIKDAADEKGFRISIQPTTPEEKEAIAKCQVNIATRTKPVADIVAYLEDSLESDTERWVNAKTYNSHDPVIVLKELIHFLKEVKILTRVMEFSLTQDEDGMDLQIMLVSPSVYSYFTRIDWKII